MELATILSWSASFFVLISFLFDGKKLRLLNGIGAVLWTLWGIMMMESAVIFLNICIIGIQLYKLKQLSKETR